jgi:hypothetical protein
MGTRFRLLGSKLQSHAMPHAIRSSSQLVGLMLAVGCCSCSDNASDGSSGSGNVVVLARGDDHAIGGIPSSAMADGWNVVFGRFVVVVSDVRVARSQTGQAVDRMEPQLFNAAQPQEAQLASFPALTAGDWDDVSFRVVAPDSSTLIAKGTQDDLRSMVQAGASVLVDGHATKGDSAKRFTWLFSRNTLYNHCQANADGKPTLGVVVSAGATETVQLVVHGAHLFYDDLQSRSAQFRFDPIAAADKDADGEITLSELDAVKLVDINEGTYGTGSASNINSLGDFVGAQAQSVVHYRSDGGCVSTAMDR